MLNLNIFCFTHEQEIMGNNFCDSYINFTTGVSFQFSVKWCENIEKKYYNNSVIFFFFFYQSYESCYILQKR